MSNPPADPPGAVAAPTAARIRRRVLLPVDALLTAVIAAVAVVRATGGTIPLLWQLVPFAVSLVALGLPHGALDHLVPGRLARRPSWFRPSGRVLALYGALGGADLVLWLVAPPAAFVLFIAVTWFHWGQGDLWTAVALQGRGGAGRPARAVRLLLRGAIPMLVPLVAFPTAYAGVASAATRTLAGTGGTDWDAVLRSPGLSTGAAVLLAALVVVDRVLDLGVSARRWWGASGETALLLALFAVVPPVLAVGLYFCVWHALRHIVRLQLLDPPSALAFDRGPWRRPWLRFCLAAAPATVAALVLLAALAALTSAPSTGVQGLGVYLVLISALTMPHVGVVALMDRRQEVWLPVARGR